LLLGAIDNRRSVIGVGNLAEAIDAALDARAAAGRAFVPTRSSLRSRSGAGDRGGIRASGAIALGPVPLLRVAGLLSGRRAMVDRLVHSLEVDPISFAAATGWQPQHTLEEGLVVTARWWRLRHAI
jgi:UDP-glucose 4-epimerase